MSIQEKLDDLKRRKEQAALEHMPVFNLFADDSERARARDIFARFGVNPRRILDSDMVGPGRV